MSNTEVVRITSAARKHARGSLDRLESHIASGNIGGASREMKFLDALERNATKQAGKVTGNVVKAPKSGLGARAGKAFAAGGDSARYTRAAVLADFSDKVMAPARPDFNQAWVWTANESACAACLLDHGNTYPASQFFSPAHKGCMCVPEPAPALARTLTDAELQGLMLNRGGRDARLAQHWMDGTLKRSDLVTKLKNGDRVQRNQAPGLFNKKPNHKWTSEELTILDDMGPLAKKPAVVQEFRANYPYFTGSDQSIWAKHQRVHDLLGKKKGVSTGKKVPTIQKPAAIPNSTVTKSFNPPQYVDQKFVDNFVAPNIHRRELWGNGSSVYEGAFNSANEFRAALNSRYGLDNIKIVEVAVNTKGKGAIHGKYRAIVRHLDVEKKLGSGQKVIQPGAKQAKTVAQQQAEAAAAKKASQQAAKIAAEKVAKEEAAKVAQLAAEAAAKKPPTWMKNKKLFQDAEYQLADDVGNVQMELWNGTKVTQVVDGKTVRLGDDVLKLLDDMDTNFIIKNKAVNQIEFVSGPIKDAPGAAGRYLNGKITIRIDGEFAGQASHTLAHELSHGFALSKPGRELMGKGFKNFWDDFLDDVATSGGTHYGDDVKAAMQYARSKASYQTGLEEAFADTWAMYLNGETALIRKMGLEDAFKDAARRLSFVPVKKRTAGHKLGEWFWKPGELRSGSPDFSKIEDAARRFFASLSRNESQIIRGYTGSGASHYNSALGRTGRHVNDSSRALERILKANPQEKHVYSWRVMPGGEDARAFVRQIEAAAKTNGEVLNKAFASSTTKPGSYGSYTPGGSRAVIEFKSRSGQFIKQQSSYSTENEFLIASNTRFRVIGIEEAQFPGQRGLTKIYKLEEIL